MIKKIKKFIVIGIAGLSMLAPGLLVPALGGVASAGIQGSICEGTNVANDSGANSASCGSNKNGDPKQGLQNLAKTITNAFSVVIGAAAVIMILFGGFRYITSGGDSGRVGSAKNTLIYAIVGLIIVALAQVIVHYVIVQSASSGADFNS